MIYKPVIFTCPYCEKEFTIQLTRKPFACPGCRRSLQFPKTDKENDQLRAFEDAFNTPLDDKDK